MGYTDKHGRPELVAQPFIYKGTAAARVVEVDDTEAAGEKGELIVGEILDAPITDEPRGDD